MVPAVRPLGSLSMARGCARIDSRPDTAKIGSSDRVEVHHARLLAVIGVRKTFPHSLDPNRKSRLLTNGRCRVAKYRGRKSYIALNRYAVGSRPADREVSTPSLKELVAFSMSALPLIATKERTCWHVSNVPTTDSCSAATASFIRSPRRHARAVSERHPGQAPWRSLD